MLKKMFKRKLVSSVLAIGILFALGIQPANAGKKDDTLIFGTMDELSNVDKYFSPNRTAMIVNRLFTDGLLYLDPVTMKLKPALASSWKWINPKLMEFELRKGVKFHDGSEMTADDVVYTFRYFSNPDVKKGGALKKIERVEKVNDYKLRIYLSVPYPQMPYRLAGLYSIRKKGCYDENGDQSLNLNPNGTGPYRLTKILDGKGFVFEKFENYYKDSPKGQPSIGKIKIRIIKEMNTQVAELLSGGVNLLYRVPTDLTESLISNPRVTVNQAVSLRIGFMAMDAAGISGDSPLKKLKVRQAISHAVNREEIAKQLIKGSAKVIHSPCHPDQFGCTEDVKRYEYNPKKAKQLLKEAGYPNGFEFKLFGFKYKPVIEAVMADLAAVGIKINLDFSRWPTVRGAWQKGTVPAVVMSWGNSSIPDVDAILPYFFGAKSKINMYNDQDVSGLIEAGSTNADPEVRIMNYHKALKLIAERAYWLPLFTDTMNYVYSKDLEFTASNDGLVRLFLTKWKK